MGWSIAHIPDQSDRTALVTGANSGIGLQAAKALAGAGATTILGCRSPEKAEAALAEITAEHPSADVELLELDLADLASIERAAAALNGREAPLDLMINNAGVMATPELRTADGFELQLGTNHLGHFALTARLYPRLCAAEAPRVVTVSSTAHRQGSIDFDNLQGERDYGRWSAYGRSKLANLLFTFELARRVSEDGAGPVAAACHPGWAATNLQTAGPGTGGGGRLRRLGLNLANVVIAQSDEMGALPTLYAATAPGVEGGDYIGPGGFMEMRGAPKHVGSTSAARDADVARRLWQVSEELTGVEFEAAC